MTADGTFRRILVASDGSERAQRAVESALSLAHALDASVFALSAYGIPRVSDMSFLDEVRLPDATPPPDEAPARRIVDRIVAQARERGLECEGVVVQGAPWEAILRVVEARRCDLVVMASHGRGSATALLLGSETQKVLAHSKLPVLVCR